MDGGRYNLKSNRRECCIPIQLQLASDDNFVMASGGHSDSSQVDFSYLIELVLTYLF